MFRLSCRKTGAPQYHLLKVTSSRGFSSASRILFPSVASAGANRTSKGLSPSLDTDISRQTLKPLDSRKTHLIDDYTRLLRGNSTVLVLHYGGLLKAENQDIRAQIKKAGGRLMVTRSALFRVALRGLEAEDPASTVAHKLYSGKKHPLSSYFNGPSAVIAVKDLDPTTVKSLVKVLDSTGDRLILLGALVDGNIMDRRAVDEFKELPSLDQLRANLAGVLTILGGAGLVQTLEASSKMLYLTMVAREKDMKEVKSENGGEES